MIRNKQKPNTLRTISALMLREMSTTYGRSPGGYLWALLEPLAGIALLSIAFGLIFRSPGLGTNFPLFYATGFLPYVIYMDTSRKVMASISFSKPLLAYPVVTMTDALFARFILNFTTYILITAIVLSGIVIVFDTRTIIDLKMITISIVLAGYLALSIGTLNCFLISQFPIWQRIWTILNRPLFILSTIFFTFEAIPELYQKFLWFNPLVHIVGLMRKGFYSTYDADFISITYVFGLSTVTLFIGLLYLTLNYRKILNQ